MSRFLEENAIYRPVKETMNTAELQMHFPIKPEILLALDGTKSNTKFTLDLMNVIYTREFMRTHQRSTQQRTFKQIEGQPPKIPKTAMNQEELKQIIGSLYTYRFNFFLLILIFWPLIQMQ